MKPFAVFVLAALAALSACSTPTPPSGAATTATTASSDRKCFFASEVNSFEAVDENLVNIRVGRNDIYQLTMFAPCYDIDWVQRIALIPRTGSSVCTGQSIAEIVSSGPSTGVHRCQVQSVRYLTPQEAAALPKGQKP